ncbi:MAG TPA: hypothetical protein VGF81_00010 [Solirubrobacteraceae bacterium]|jgi:hypothetical protein
MNEQERRFAPTDPSVEDDLLAPEPREGATESETPDEAKESDQVMDGEGAPEAQAEETEEGADGEERPRSPQRQLVRVGWAAVAVLVVIGALMVVELVRLSNAVNNNGCILRAQASFLQAEGPGVNAGFAGLDRLVGQNQLKKCSQ